MHLKLTQTVGGLLFVLLLAMFAFSFVWFKWYDPFLE
jgi:hypothetical protein